MAPSTQRQHSPWPKRPVPLTEEEQAILQDWRQYWHTQFSQKIDVFEKFSRRYLTKLAERDAPDAFPNTLEIGPGLTGASGILSERRSAVLERDPGFARVIAERFPKLRVYCGDIQDRHSDLAGGSFDRVVALHVLEHLPNLPAALEEVSRILKDTGVFDVIIPCEGGGIYSLGRALTTSREFRKRYGRDFTRFISADHVNSAGEILDCLRERFRVESQEYFPLRVPSPHLNLCVGLRLRKRA